MLAEQASSIDVPPTLWDKARVLAGEPAWPAADALIAVNWLAAQGQIIAGVELWQEHAGNLKWRASSDYAMPNGSLTISAGAEGARQFIARFANEPAALFNLTWIAGDVSQ